MRNFKTCLLHCIRNMFNYLPAIWPFDENAEFYASWKFCMHNLDITCFQFAENRRNHKKVKVWIFREIHIQLNMVKPDDHMLIHINCNKKVTTIKRYQDELGRKPLIQVVRLTISLVSINTSCRCGYCTPTVDIWH